MARKSLNYDALASGYDRRFEGREPMGRGSAVSQLANRIAAVAILEVGCGTGHWLSSLSDGTFDLVFCINALHHFASPRGFVAEAHRVLRPGGTLAIVGSDPHGARETWYGYQFFEGTYETDLARFPEWSRVEQWAQEAGLEGIGRREVEHVDDPKRGWEVLDDPYLRKSSCSQLALLSDEEYQAGLGRIWSTLVRADQRGEERVFASGFRIEMLTAVKPGAS
jgi:SAM-dependent methyltransferase